MSAREMAESLAAFYMHESGAGVAAALLLMLSLAAFALAALEFAAWRRRGAASRRIVRRMRHRRG